MATKSTTSTTTSRYEMRQRRKRFTKFIRWVHPDYRERLTAAYELLKKEWSEDVKK